MTQIVKQTAFVLTALLIAPSAMVCGMDENGIPGWCQPHLVPSKKPAAPVVHVRKPSLNKNSPKLNLQQPPYEIPLDVEHWVHIRKPDSTPTPAQRAALVQQMNAADQQRKPQWAGFQAEASKPGVPAWAKKAVSEHFATK